MFPPPEACKLIFIAVTLFGAHDVPLFLCPYLATSTAPTPPPALPCRYSSHPRRCPPAARGLRCTGLLRLGLRLYALPIPLACAHLLRTRVPLLALLLPRLWQGVEVVETCADVAMPQE